jgi:FecR-like protein
MAERDLDRLFQAWRSEPVPPSLPSSDDRSGSALVAAALRQVAERKRRRRGWRRWGTALALAAGVSGLGVGAWLELARAPVQTAALEGSSQIQLAARDGDVAITDGVGDVVNDVSALSEGYGVRTDQGGVTLGFPSGAQARVAHKSALKITAARVHEALFLASGAVDVEVPKLDPSRGFSVETPDARVTVHGTRFSVLVEPTADGPRTRVAVTRGIVSVQQAGHEVFLTAGQVWPAGAAQPAPGAVPSAAAAPDAGAPEDEPAATAPAQPDGKAASEQRARPRKFDSRELADQNRRFTRAMNSKKAGEPEAALRDLDRLVRRYPGSPLTQEVRVERLRLLRALGRSEAAAREAQRYIREFPDGYAVPEARESLPERP